MVENFLRCTDLLNITVAHDDNAVAEGHGFGLVVCNIDKGGVDPFTQFDNLGTHLVAQFGVEVGQRLVHQKDLRVAHNGTADGNTLTLTA